MTQSIVDAQSILAVDIGSTHTRALLFDVVDGQYRFISAGIAASTAHAPFFHIGEGVQQAIRQLEELSARNFFDAEGRLILPSDINGNGIDQMAVTYSGGPFLQIATLGLLEELSLRSVNRLAASLPGEIVESIGLADRRRPEEQIDALLKAQPDLILLAGGIEGGANRSVARLSGLVQFALQVVARDKHTEVIYAGNQSLAGTIKEMLEPHGHLHIAPNIRPVLDGEDLSPALDVAAEVLTEIRSRQLDGLQALGEISSQEPVPAQYAYGRMIRFLSQVYDRSKGVLGLDLGSGTTTLASGRQGKLNLSVAPYGLGSGLLQALAKSHINDILQWLPIKLPSDAVRDYLYNKALFPETVPATEEALAIEHAMVRQLVRLGVNRMNADWPNMTMSYEPILASGQVFSQASNPWQSLLMLLDGLQPVGITTLVLDSYGLLPALGALAEKNPLLPVQVIESNAFFNLGTIIAPMIQARPGSTVLKVRVEYDQGEETRLDVKQGTLIALPIRPGQAARVHLQPLRHMEIDPLRKEQARSFRIVGGACGALIDTRGRPLVLPSDPERRTRLLQEWSAALA